MVKSKGPEPRIQVPGHVLIRRKLIAPDERLLTALPVDFATMTVTPDAIVHSLYQARLPVTEGQPDEVEAALVGRFQYGPAHARALVALMIRQFLILEATLDRSQQESISFLQEQISKTVAGLESKRETKQPS